MSKISPENSWLNVAYAVRGWHQNNPLQTKVFGVKISLRDWFFFIEICNFKLLKMPEQLNFRFPGGRYYLNCNTTDLKRSTKIFYFHVNGRIGILQKIDFEIRPDLGCTTLKTSRKVVLNNPSVCLYVCFFCFRAASLGGGGLNMAGPRSKDII